jgi:thiamine biosynthesis protein ThiI
MSLSVLLRYQELALKGRNRPWFQRHLIQHLRRALGGLGVREVRVPMGRIELVLGRDATAAEVCERLRWVFGLANFSLATRVEPDYAAIEAGIVRDLPHHTPASFRVKVRRADKRFPLRSPELERALGARIVEARGWTVDLRKPALIIGVEIVPGEAFYYFGKEPGAGGLPTGTGGRLVALLSGGIDSPVAAWRMMRRGCTVTFVHFHSYPFLSRASQDKARQLVQHLCRFQLSATLQIVPFGEIQRQVTLSVPSALRVVVYRRLMLRIAERVAGRIGAHGLVTGDVVGQVASQTLENMSATGAVVRLQIFRPLVGMDKDEITGQAERLGTYDISVQPDEDCCTLFTPRHPITRARLEEVEAAERGLAVDEFIDSALRSSVVERFAWPQEDLRA